MTTHEPDRRTAEVAWWPDDEADIMLGAIEALRTGTEMQPEFLAAALRSTRRLQNRTSVVADELLLYARKPGADGRPRMTFRAIAQETGQHHTSVAERYGRLTAPAPEFVPAWFCPHAEYLLMWDTATLGWTLTRSGEPVATTPGYPVGRPNVTEREATTWADRTIGTPQTWITRPRGGEVKHTHADPAATCPPRVKRPHP